MIFGLLFCALFHPFHYPTINIVPMGQFDCHDYLLEGEDGEWEDEGGEGGEGEVEGEAG